LYKAISVIKNEEEAQLFFADLCTPAELESMSDRWGAVEALKSGKAYRKIHEDTGVSVTTVGRVSRCISYGNGGYDLIFDRIQRNEK
jgi:TrpR-related protein YerC/YecD